jgi:hypothetical protein
VLVAAIYLSLSLSLSLSCSLSHSCASLSLSSLAPFLSHTLSSTSCAFGGPPSALAQPRWQDDFRVASGAQAIESDETVFDVSNAEKEKNKAQASAARSDEEEESESSSSSDSSDGEQQKDSKQASDNAEGTTNASSQTSAGTPVSHSTAAQASLNEAPAIAAAVPKGRNAQLVVVGAAITDVSGPARPQQQP